MAASRQVMACASSRSPNPLARLATAVVPNSDDRLRWDALACRLTNSRQARPADSPAARKAADENHVANIIELPKVPIEHSAGKQGDLCRHLGKHLSHVTTGGHALARSCPRRRSTPGAKR